MSCPVKYFTSSMAGIPTLVNSPGSLVALLDACLVDGFGLQTVTSLTRAGNIVTATIATGNIPQPGQVQTIFGADQAEYNGEVRVLTVATNSFTYSISGSPVSPATGTILTKSAPLGFDRIFTDTNKRVYRSKNLQSNRPYLRIDDGFPNAHWDTTWSHYGKVTMAANMTDIDHFDGPRAPFDPVNPNKNEEVKYVSGSEMYNGWYKWIYSANDTHDVTPAAVAHAGARDFVIIGDDRGFYLFNGTGFPNDKGLTTYAFTDFPSFRTADKYNTILCATDAYANEHNILGGDFWGGYTSRMVNTYDVYGKILMRDHLQIGGNIHAAFTSLNTNNGACTSGLNTNIPWPNPADYGLLLHPTYIAQDPQNVNGIRGKMPGMMWVLNSSPLSHLDKITGVVGYPGREFMMIKCGAWGACTLAFDITGPWW